MQLTRVSNSCASPAFHIGDAWFLCRELKGYVSAPICPGCGAVGEKFPVYLTILLINHVEEVAPGSWYTLAQTV